MSTGLHARKKQMYPSAPGDDQGPDVEEQEMNKAPVSGGIDRVHRRRSSFMRFIQSEVGCAIEMVVVFLIAGLFLGYLMLHHQQRKVS
jgi:hypothetical protein